MPDFGMIITYTYEHNRVRYYKMQKVAAAYVRHDFTCGFGLDDDYDQDSASFCKFLDFPIKFDSRLSIIIKK